MMAEELAREGWEYHSGYWVLKGRSVRLGWSPKTHEVIIGYSLVPVRMESMDEMHALMRALKM